MRVSKKIEYIMNVSVTLKNNVADFFIVFFIKGVVILMIQAVSNLDPYEELANAIIIQAVTDYRESRIILKTCPKDKDAMKMIRDVTGFFKSDFFKILTTIDPDELLQKLRAEFK